MKRRIFKWLAVVSLLLAITVAGLWVRSVWWAGDAIFVQTGGQGFVVFSVAGRIGGGRYGWIGQRWCHSRIDPTPTDWVALDDNTLLGTATADWMWLALLLILPGFWVFRKPLARHFQEEAERHQRLQYESTGCCPKCGYDLRASKDKCPECGEPIPVPQPAVSEGTA